MTEKTFKKWKIIGFLVFYSLLFLWDLSLIWFIISNWDVISYILRYLLKIFYYIFSFKLSIPLKWFFGAQKVGIGTQIIITVVKWRILPVYFSPIGNLIPLYISLLSINLLISYSFIKEYEKQNRREKHEKQTTTKNKH